MTVAESSNPSSGSMGTGSVTGFYDDDNNNNLEVYAIYANLLANPNAAHVHPGAVGQNGAPLYGMTAGTSNAASLGVYSVTTAVQQSDEDKLKADGLYVNVHTPTIGGGEVRTQLIRQSALALDYKQFQAAAVDNQIELSWKATETPQKNFTIEHRLTNSLFSEMGKVEANEMNPVTQTYTFTSPKLNSGVHYFRLRATDAGGVESVSAVVAVRLNTATDNAISIFPNPVSDESFLIFN